MAHVRKSPRRGGAAQIAFGMGIITAIGLHSSLGTAIADRMGIKAVPAFIMTIGNRSDACAADTVDTIIGTIGCGGIKKASHLQKITLVSADKTG